MAKFEAHPDVHNLTNKSNGHVPWAVLSRNEHGLFESYYSPYTVAEFEGVDAERHAKAHAETLNREDELKTN